MDKKKLSEGFSAEDGLRLTLGGKDPSRRYTDDELDEFKSSLGGLLEGVKPTAALNKGTYLVTIFDPDRRIHYHTIAVNGEIQYANDEGKWSPNQLHDNVEPLLRRISREGIPTQTQVIDRSKPKNDKKRKTGKKDKKQEFNTFDPSLERFIEKEAKYLTYAAFYREESAEEKVKLTSEELELTNPELAAQAKKLGYEVTAETIENFILKHKQKIIERRRIYVNMLMKDARVTRLFSEFIGYVKAQPGDPSAFFAEENYAKDVFDWFKKNNKTEYTASDVLVAIRDEILNTYRDQASVRKSIMSGTNHWVGLAEAAEYLESKPELKEDALSGFVDDETDETKLSHRTYEGVRRIAKRVLVDREYTLDQYKFMIKGLWMHGRLRTDRKHEHAQLKVSETEMVRSAKGTEVYFIGPVSHLWNRFEKYDPHLDSQFGELLRKGEIEKATNLTILPEYLGLGRKIFDSLNPDVRRATFTRIDDGKTPLTETGTQLEWVLSMYVGVKRDQFLEMLKKHYG